MQRTGEGDGQQEQCGQAVEEYGAEHHCALPLEVLCVQHPSGAGPQAKDRNLCFTSGHIVAKRPVISELLQASTDPVLGMVKLQCTSVPNTWMFCINKSIFNAARTYKCPR